MRSPGLHRLPTTPGTSGFSGQGRQAHIRLSKLRAWKLPNSPGRMCRTCVHSPAIHAESGVKAVATPTGAPTCPPWVASSAGLAQESGAQEPGVLGSQPEAPGPQASTMPPPVTRQPLTGVTGQTLSSLFVTVAPDTPTTSQVTDTSSHALAVRPLTLPVADAIAPGSSVAIVAGVVGTGVPVPVGGQVVSFLKMLSVMTQ